MLNETTKIRTAVLLGHAQSGKITLAETMLFESGGIPQMGSVEEKNTKSDFNENRKNQRK